MRKTIGIIGGGMKPFHKGHYNNVKTAADESDEVYLFVSNKDRARKGEQPIYWEDMKQVWEKYLKKALPDNVKVFYTGNPTTAMYSVLEDANAEETNNNSYVIYGRQKDIDSYFSDKKLAKAAPRLFENDQISRRGVSGPGSGTEMRQYISAGDLESFTANLPEPVQRYGKEIFEILSQKQ